MDIDTSRGDEIQALLRELVEERRAARQMAERQRAARFAQNRADREANWRMVSVPTLAATGFVAGGVAGNRVARGAGYKARLLATLAGGVAASMAGTYGGWRLGGALGRRKAKKMENRELETGERVEDQAARGQSRDTRNMMLYQLLSGK